MGAIYANCGGIYCALANSTTLVNLTTTTCGTQAKITNCKGVSCPLYLYNAGTYTPLYFNCN